MIEVEYKCELFRCFKPMLAGRVEMRRIIELIESEEYIWETKFDGERIQLHLDKTNQQIEYFSRNMHNITNIYGKSLDSLLFKYVQADKCILDAELIVIDSMGVQQPFGNNKTVANQDQFVHSQFNLALKVFDILYVSNHNHLIHLLDQPLYIRK